MKVAVNVSPILFRRGDLPRLVHSVLMESGLAANRLELEITEGVLIDDFSRAVSILRRLKALGVQIVLDDFGTGYSSLSYLRAFPFDKLKIDRSFIADLEGNQQSIAIVQAVIGLCRSLKIPVLAEGVETKAQHAFLTREGCDEVQGYLTGRPAARDRGLCRRRRKKIDCRNAGPRQVDCRIGPLRACTYGRRFAKLRRRRAGRRRTRSAMSTQSEIRAPVMVDGRRFARGRGPAEHDLAGGAELPLVFGQALRHPPLVGNGVLAKPERIRRTGIRILLRVGDGREWG